MKFEILFFQTTRHHRKHAHKRCNGRKRVTKKNIFRTYFRLLATSTTTSSLLGKTWYIYFTDIYFFFEHIPKKNYHHHYTNYYLVVVVVKEYYLNETQCGAQIQFNNKPKTRTPCKGVRLVCVCINKLFTFRIWTPLSNG